MLNDSSKLSLEVATAITFRLEFKKMIFKAMKHAEEMAAELQTPEVSWDHSMEGPIERSTLIRVAV